MHGRLKQWFLIYEENRDQTLEAWNGWLSNGYCSPYCVFCFHHAVTEDDCKLWHLFTCTNIYSMFNKFQATVNVCWKTMESHPGSLARCLYKPRCTLSSPDAQSSVSDLAVGCIYFYLIFTWACLFLTMCEYRRRRCCQPSLCPPPTPHLLVHCSLILFFLSRQPCPPGDWSVVPLMC